MVKGLVSTIIPVFNRPTMLVTSVNSVLNQTYKQIEIIIIDDGSTDETLNIAREIASKNKCVTVLSIENSGPGVAREHGRLICKGEFIQYLDSDDVLMSEKFSHQVQSLRKSNNAAACYCKTSIEVFDEKDSYVQESWKRTGEEISTILPSMLNGRWWGTSSPLYRRSVCDEAGPWKALINEEDWEYDCRLAKISNELCYVDKTLSVELQHNGARLSENGDINPDKLRSRCDAHLAVVNTAIACNFDYRTFEFEQLLIACFLLSRQCGNAGLTEQSKLLLLAAKTHLRPWSKARTKVNIYQLCSLIFGLKTMGRISNKLDRLRA